MTREAVRQTIMEMERIRKAAGYARSRLEQRCFEDEYKALWRLVWPYVNAELPFDAPRKEAKC
jgi:hypothetical protein